MKKLHFTTLILVFFVCGKCFSNVYLNPGVYGYSWMPPKSSAEQAPSFVLGRIRFLKLSGDELDYASKRTLVQEEYSKNPDMTLGILLKILNPDWAHSIESIKVVQEVKVLDLNTEIQDIIRDIPQGETITLNIVINELVEVRFKMKDFSHHYLVQPVYFYHGLYFLLYCSRRGGIFIKRIGGTEFETDNALYDRTRPDEGKIEDKENATTLTLSPNELEDFENMHIDEHRRFIRQDIELHRVINGKPYESNNFFRYCDHPLV